ncbi:MAG: hypothetical protein LBM09_00855 [Candidatus Nomurabacteria bacterium]|jgi:hypothetical protein|nr:hypothetical protein [Candidatus Nomurabacteria bacterium]
MLESNKNNNRETNPNAVNWEIASNLNEDSNSGLQFADDDRVLDFADEDYDRLNFADEEIDFNGDFAEEIDFNGEYAEEIDFSGELFSEIDFSGEHVAEIDFSNELGFSENNDDKTEPEPENKYAELRQQLEEDEKNKKVRTAEDLKNQIRVLSVTIDDFDRQIRNQNYEIDDIKKKLRRYEDNADSEQDHDDKIYYKNLANEQYYWLRQAENKISSLRNEKYFFTKKQEQLSAELHAIEAQM